MKRNEVSSTWTVIQNRVFPATDTGVDTLQQPIGTCVTVIDKSYSVVLSGIHVLSMGTGETNIHVPPKTKTGALLQLSDTSKQQCIGKNKVEQVLYTRGPSHLLPSNEVDVKVIYRLTAMSAIVENWG